MTKQDRSTIYKQAKDVLTYDADTGEFTWKEKPTKSCKVVVGKRAGTLDINGGYRKITINGVREYEHRLAWFMYYNVIPDMIDHINRNRSDNRIVNLRLTTKEHNAKNAKLNSRNISGVAGVSFDKREQRWRSVVRVCNKQIELGYFKSLDHAVLARKLAEPLYGYF